MYDCGPWKKLYLNLYTIISSLIFVHPFMQKSVAILSSTEICSLLSHEFKFDMSLGFYLVNVNKKFGERTIRQITASRCMLKGGCDSE